MPGFVIFRSPIFKFGYALWFAYSILLAVSLGYIIRWAKNRLWSRRVFFYPLTITVVAVFIILYHYPYLTGDIFLWSKGRLATRVSVPHYVFDTVEWFDQQDTVGRILLLPRANTTWNADIYTWKYFSLYPLLANVSRLPFLYNHDGLSENERVIIYDVYHAILAQDVGRISTLSRILRISHVVVRNDYYYDLDWAQTDPPRLYTEAIEKIPLFSKTAQFGAWDVYELDTGIDNDQVELAANVTIYNPPEEFIKALHSLDVTTDEVVGPPVFIAQSSADLIGGMNTLVDRELSIAVCSTCRALRVLPSISFPDLRILPNSPLYKLAKSITGEGDRVPYNQSDTNLYDLLGRSLIYTQELFALSRVGLSQEEATRIYPEVTEHLEATYQAIDRNIDDLSHNHAEYIATAPTILAYVRAEEERLRDVVSNNIMRSYYEVLLGPLRTLVRIKQKIESSIARIEYIDDKLFVINDVRGKHEAYLFDDERSVESYTAGTIVYNDRVASGSAVSSKALHIEPFSAKEEANVVVALPEENLAEQGVEYRYDFGGIGPTTCYGARIENTEGVLYRIAFDLYNNFSHELNYVIFPLDDDYVNTGLTKPLYLEKLPRHDDVVQRKEFHYKNDLRVSSSVFIGVCAPQLTKVLFTENIRSFSIYRLYNPYVILLGKNSANREVQQVPNHRIEKVNQTKYSIHVENAQTPYILLLHERFHEGWEVYFSDQPAFFLTKSLASEHHLEVNGYSNGWYIDKPGTYSLVIEYRPQRMFYYGLGITGISLSGVFLYVIFRFYKR
jgi:hypothetical protein